VSPSEQVEYYYEKLIIPRNVQTGEGICRRSSLVSSVREEYLDAGANLHLGNDKLVKNVQKVMLEAENPRTSEEGLVMIQCGNGLIWQEKNLKELLNLMIFIILDWMLIAISKVSEVKGNGIIYLKEAIETLIDKQRNLEEIYN
jgi:hypothetical protein